MTESLGSLLSRSWGFYKKHLVPIAVGAVIVGAIMLALQLQMQRSVQTNLLGGMKFDSARMEQLQRRVESGDPQAIAEMQREAQKMIEGFTGDSGVVGKAVAEIGWSLLLSIFVSMLVSLLYNGYILLLVVEDKSVQATFQRLIAFAVPLLGLSVWLFIRSFVWIPLAGIVIAIILAPRFILAPIILMHEGKGVMASASESYARTRGMWGKIVGNTFVASFCAWMAAMVVTIVLSIALRGSQVYVTPFIQALVGGFISVFVTYLGLSLLQVQAAASTPAPALAAVPPVIQ
jgi:hypothetical protein